MGKLGVESSTSSFKKIFELYFMDSEMNIFHVLISLKLGSLTTPSIFFLSTLWNEGAYSNWWHLRFDEIWS